MPRKSKLVRENPDRHNAFLLMRQSKYPVEVIVDGHSVYLNPMKRMLKNKPYVNNQYQVELDRLLREHMMKQRALATAVADEAEVSNDQ